MHTHRTHSSPFPPALICRYVKLPPQFAPSVCGIKEKNGGGSCENEKKINDDLRSDEGRGGVLRRSEEGEGKKRKEERNVKKGKGDNEQT